MEKRILIAGCRSYSNYDEAREFIESCMELFQASDRLILVSGTCRGADRLGERFARERGWTIEPYPAQWHKYGKAAGPIRNREMVAACDAVICFWDGKSKGTGALIQFAKASGKPLAVKMIEA